MGKGRLHETMDGKYAFELKTPWSDGTRVIFFSGEELVARLTALVPPPRTQLVHYSGILTPHSRLSPLVVSKVPDEDEDASMTHGACSFEEDRRGRTVRRRWVVCRAERLLRGLVH